MYFLDISRVALPEVVCKDGFFSRLFPSVTIMVVVCPVLFQKVVLIFKLAWKYPYNQTYCRFIDRNSSQSLISVDTPDLPINWENNAAGYC